MTPQVLTSGPARQEVGGELRPGSTDRVAEFLGILALLLTAIGYYAVPAVVSRLRVPGGDPLYRQAQLRLDDLLGGILAATFLLAPGVHRMSLPWRHRWREPYTYVVLSVLCVFLTGFLIHFGRCQFGAYDFNILIETGWRQLHGQRPYVDFPTTTPPGFNLGVKWAFELFGATWDANLYLSAIFACGTFLWMYWLLRVLELRRSSAAGVALAIECAGMLTGCFWWYNNSTLILAAVFFLACLAYVSRPWSAWVQASYVISLATLALMKPNIAGLTILGGVAVLFAATENRLRLLWLTLAAASLALLVLAANHVSIPAMLASYRGVASAHGGIGARFGYREMTKLERGSAIVWIFLLAVPLLGLLPGSCERLRSRDWRGLALSFLFVLALLIAGYGLLTNGEYRDVECTVLLAAGGVLSLGDHDGGHPLLRRFFIAMVCATMAGDLYYGAERLRVHGIGPHVFFEWQDNRQRIESGVLKNMRVSSAMIETEREVDLAKARNPGPYFLGTRLDFNYAVLGLDSPIHFPAWWEPGTAFGVAQVPGILQLWKSHDFQTLILLKKDDNDGFDHTYYPQEFLDAIASGYDEDDSYSHIRVYHRRDAALRKSAAWNAQPLSSLPLR